MAKKDEIKEMEPIEPAKQPPIAEKPIERPAAVRRPAHSWNLGRIFWGLLLVLIGGLALASNYGWVTLNWFNIWRLWPLFIVMIGLSVLSVQGWAWRLVSITVLILSLLAVAFSLTYYNPQASPTSVYDLSAPRLATAVDAVVNLKDGVGKININTADQVDVAKTHLESNITKLTSDSAVNGTTQVTNISMDSTSNWPNSNVNNQLSMDITRNLPTKLTLDVGAAEVTADLSLAQLQSLDIKSGATKTDIKLGDKEALATVNLNSGASSFIVRVPASSGVSIKLDGAVSRNNMNELVKKDDSYQTVGYDSATKKINITGSLGLASFTLERY